MGFLILQRNSDRLLPLIFLLLIGGQAQAILGDLPNATPAAQNENTYSRQAEPLPTSPLFRVKQSAYTGGVAREYFNSNGVVFAIAWTGMSEIPHSKFLGSYTAKYQAAMAKYNSTPQNGFRKPHVTFQADDFVHINYGHMGAVRGLTYIPSLVPAGVSLQDLK